MINVTINLVKHIGFKCAQKPATPITSERKKEEERAFELDFCCLPMWVREFMHHPRLWMGMDGWMDGWMDG